MRIWIPRANLGISANPPVALRLRATALSPAGRSRGSDLHSAVDRCLVRISESFHSRLATFLYLCTRVCFCHFVRSVVLLAFVRRFVITCLLLLLYFVIRVSEALCVGPPLLANVLICAKVFVREFAFTSPRGRGRKPSSAPPAVVPVQEGRKTAEAELVGVKGSARVSAN